MTTNLLKLPDMGHTLGITMSCNSPVASDCSTECDINDWIKNSRSHSQVDGWDLDTDHVSKEEEFAPYYIHGNPGAGGVSLSPFRPEVVQYVHQGTSYLEHTVQEQIKAKRLTSTTQNDDPETGSQKKHFRPCKGKRDRFRKVIDHLKDKVHEELEDFDLDNIELPKFMACDLKTIDRVKSMMEGYQRQVLQGLLPDLDAKDIIRKVKKASTGPMTQIVHTKF